MHRFILHISVHIILFRYTSLIDVHVLVMQRNPQKLAVLLAFCIAVWF